MGGTPTGTNFFRDDFTWQAVTATIGSGSVGSGAVASGAVQGFFGTTPDIASGTVGFWDFGSGAVVAGSVGSGAIRSGNIASGQLSSYHLASGTLADSSQYVLRFVSGLSHMTAITEETISGVRAVCLSQSGNLRVAMASVSGRMSAIGVVVDNVLSGIQVNAYTDGTFQFTSGMADYSGYIGQILYVGRSGQIVTSSGSFNSGGILSGDITQPLGVVFGSGAGSFAVAATLQFILNQATSGSIASGQLDTYHHASGCTTRASQFSSPIQSGTSWTLLTEETISGARAVCISQSGKLRIAMASVSGRMPAMGIVVDNVLSGINANVYTHGLFQSTSGMADYSGYLGKTVWVGRSGQIVSWSGSYNSGGLVTTSGSDFMQRVGYIVNSGAFIANVQPSAVINVGIALSTDTFIDVAAMEFGL
jgi:hypothetical protein